MKKTILFTCSLLLSVVFAKPDFVDAWFMQSPYYSNYYNPYYQGYMYYPHNYQYQQTQYYPQSSPPAPSIDVNSSTINNSPFTYNYNYTVVQDTNTIVTQPSHVGTHRDSLFPFPSFGGSDYHKKFPFPFPW